MKKVLFLIHDLGGGGAEKVLVNLVNHMDQNRYDITVLSLFDYGVNKQYLNSNIHYKSCFKKMIRGNSKFMKLLSPRQLHKWLIKDTYDIEVAFLEGPSTRIISGCPTTDTKLVSWVHSSVKGLKHYASSYRSAEEADKCYKQFDRIIGVSESVKQKFKSYSKCDVPMSVLYNTNDSKMIKELANEPPELFFSSNEINIIGVGKLEKNKGFDRLARITKRLTDEGYNIHTYILGEGPERNSLTDYINSNSISGRYTLLGYKSNPYKYIKQSDIFVCSSYSEGFSTAATEALILGVPVCTVEVSGMKEMLGDNDDYGIIVKNDEECLGNALKKLIGDNQLLSHYKKKAIERGVVFNTENSVAAVQQMLQTL